MGHFSVSFGVDTLLLQLKKCDDPFTTIYPLVALQPAIPLNGRKLTLIIYCITGQINSSCHNDQSVLFGLAQLLHKSSG